MVLEIHNWKWIPLDASDYKKAWGAKGGMVQ